MLSDLRNKLKSIPVDKRRAYIGAILCGQIDIVSIIDPRNQGG